MSRSYKHTPSCNCIKPDSSMKRIFNRKLRRTGQLDIPSGNAYRKMNESWEIHDWRVVGYSYARFRDHCIEHDPEFDERTCREEYDKWYRRK